MTKPSMPMPNPPSTLPSSPLHPPIAQDVPQIAKDVGFRQALSRLIDTHLRYAHTAENDPLFDARQAAAAAAWNAVCAVAEAFLLSRPAPAAEPLTAEPLTAEPLTAEPLAVKPVDLEPLTAAPPDDQKLEEQRTEVQKAKQRAAQEQEDADNLRMARFVARLYPLARRQFKVERSWSNPWYKEPSVKKQEKAWEDLIDHLLSLRDEEGENPTWIDRFENAHLAGKECRKEGQRKKEKKRRRKDKEPREPKQGPHEPRQDPSGRKNGASEKRQANEA